MAHWHSRLKFGLLAAAAAVALSACSAAGLSTYGNNKLAVADITNIGSYWFSDKIVLRMYKAKPVAVDHPLY